jgi:hypothetical protein
VIVARFGGEAEKEELHKIAVIQADHQSIGPSERLNKKSECSWLTSVQESHRIHVQKDLEETR